MKLGKGSGGGLENHRITAGFEEMFGENLNPI